MENEVFITVRGPVGSGKSKLLAEVCVTLKALGVPYRFANRDTKHGVEADMQEGRTDWIALYKPTVVLAEEPVSRTQKPIGPPLREVREGGEPFRWPRWLRWFRRGHRT